MELGGVREIVSPDVAWSAPPVDQAGAAQLDHQPDERIELS
jgi:hypothetical protein